MATLLMGHFDRREYNEMLLRYRRRAAMVQEIVIADYRWQIEHNWRNRGCRRMPLTDDMRQMLDDVGIEPLQIDPIIRRKPYASPVLSDCEV